jgi:fucose permease
MTRSSPPNVRQAFVYLFVNFLLFGGIATTVGATLPLVIREFGWNYLVAGWIFAGSAAGFFISTFITGMLLPSWGARNGDVGWFDFARAWAWSFWIQ